MKKHIIICLLIAFSLILIGCADKDFDTSPELPSATEVPTQIETENTPPSESEEENETGDVSLKSEQPTEISTEQPTENLTEQPTEAPTENTGFPSESETGEPPLVTDQSTENTGDSFDMIVFEFPSIKDMHTYVTTRSTNPEDYECPSRIFPDLSTLDRRDFDAAFALYQPFNRYFKFDENDFDQVHVDFHFTEPFSNILRFRACLDRITVTITHVETDHIWECYFRKSEELHEYSAKDTVKNGCLLQKTPDYEAIFYMKNGKKDEVHLLIDHTYIFVRLDTITVNWDTAYKEITTNAKYSCFAPLFSDDEKVFSNALASIKAAKENTPPSESEEATENDNKIGQIFEHEANECQFDSVQDLETYLLTGSTKESDYLHAPDFDAFPQIDGIQTNEFVRKGYIKLKDLYNINVDDCESFDSVSFQFTPDFIIFNYYFSTNCITVTYAPSYFKNSSTSDYYEAYCQYASRQYAPQSFDVSSKLDDGYVIRTNNQQEVVYQYKNGIPRSAGMMVGDFLIAVTTAASSDPEEASREYLQFMQDDSFKQISSVFAEEDSLFSQSVEKTADTATKFQAIK